MDRLSKRGWGRRTLVGAAVAVCLTLGGCGGDKTRQVLMAADDHPLDYPTTQGLVFIGDYLAQKTGGRLTLDIFPNKTLGDEKSTIEQAQLGALDINRVNVSPLAQLAPELGVLSLPYIFRDIDHMHAVLDGPIGEELLSSLEPWGLVGLCYYDSGARSFYNNQRPILHPADLVGLKIRVQKSEIMIDMVQALGASPTPMAFGEVYSSLQTGVIQGAENNWPSYDYTGHYQAAKHYCLDEHSLAPEMVVISKRTWDRLSAEDRALIKEAARASVPRQRELWKALEKEAEAKIRAAGNQINQVADKNEFIRAMDPVYAKHVQDPRMKDLVKRIREFPTPAAAPDPTSGGAGGNPAPAAGVKNPP
jgi:tripartite ATP-independent transporter DctP family solute receptor